MEPLRFLYRSWTHLLSRFPFIRHEQVVHQYNSIVSGCDILDSLHSVAEFTPELGTVGSNRIGQS